MLAIIWQIYLDKPVSITLAVCDMFLVIADTVLLHLCALVYVRMVVYWW